MSAIKKYYNNSEITSIEIREEEKITLSKYGNVYIDDFLKWKQDKKYHTIITNPPYSLAQKIIEKCFEISNSNTEIIMLLRLAFLESQQRYDFWQKHPLSSLYVLSKRPSFTGKGTDATAYGWFVWNSQKKGIYVI